MSGFEHRVEKLVWSAFYHLVQSVAHPTEPSSASTVSAMTSLMTVYGQLSSNKLFGLESESMPILLRTQPGSKFTRSTFVNLEVSCLQNR